MVICVGSSGLSNPPRENGKRHRMSWLCRHIVRHTHTHTTQYHAYTQLHPTTGYAHTNTYKHTHTRSMTRIQDGCVRECVSECVSESGSVTLYALVRREAL